VRLEILNLIGREEMSFGKLQAAVGVSKTNLSQHLAILRKAHIVIDHREGVNMIYRLAFPEIAEACHSVGEALTRHFVHVGEQAKVLLQAASRR